MTFSNKPCAASAKMIRPTQNVLLSVNPFLRAGSNDKRIKPTCYNKLKPFYLLSPKHY